MLVLDIFDPSVSLILSTCSFHLFLVCMSLFIFCILYSYLKSFFIHYKTFARFFSYLCIYCLLRFKFLVRFRSYIYFSMWFFVHGFYTIILTSIVFHISVWTKYHHSSTIFQTFFLELHTIIEKDPVFFWYSANMDTFIFINS